MSKKPDDHDLFHRTLADVKPLKRGAARIAKPDATPKPAIEKKASPPAKEAPPPAPRTKPVVLPALDSALDQRTTQRLRRGQVEIDGKLDLHGMILAQAEPALSRFLAQAQERGLRSVLVVTGKGTKIDAETGRITDGAIRRELPHWLNLPKNRSRVIGYRAAHARHGGGGAFYVLIKRIR